MLGQHIRIGTLNTRSIFKASYKTKRKEFSSFLRTFTGVDILCLQEVSHFHSQVSLSDDQIRSFSFLFPRCSFVVSKHCAIVCLKPGLSLDSTVVALDERFVAASVMDAQQNVLCRVASVYVPAQSSDRPQFLDSFLSLPLWSEVSNTPGCWQVISTCTCTLLLKWCPILLCLHGLIGCVFHFNDCFPDGPVTFPSAGTTIDYIFGHSSLAPRLVNPRVHYIASDWTDHCLLTVDLLSARVDIGPGCWRFNPVLLGDSNFLALLDKTVDAFFASVGDGVDSSPSGERVPRLVQGRWESLKLILKCCAQRYTKGAKSRFKNKVAKLQQERMQAVSASVWVL